MATNAPKKAKAPPTHPKFNDMIKEAIVALKEVGMRRMWAVLSPSPGMQAIQHGPRCAYSPCTAHKQLLAFHAIIGVMWHGRQGLMQQMGVR